MAKEPYKPRELFWARLETRRLVITRFICERETEKQYYPQVGSYIEMLGGFGWKPNRISKNAGIVTPKLSEAYEWGIEQMQHRYDLAKNELRADEEKLAELHRRRAQAKMEESPPTSSP